MVTANFCKMNSLALVCEYCEKNIEPLLLKNSGPILYGKYNESGTRECYISDTYAAEPPRIRILSAPAVTPKDIKEFLTALGYKVDWVKVEAPYLAGYSSSKRTKYYNAGCNIYWSLKISY